MADRGWSELIRLLDTLPAKVERKLLGLAAGAGARVLAKQAQIEAPVDTGELRASIRVRAARSRSTAVRTRLAGVIGKESALAHLIENGTAPHTIEAQPGGFLLLPNGQRVTRVNHPGAAANPFLTRAFQKSSTEAGERTADNLSNGIEREMQRLVNRK